MEWGLSEAASGRAGEEGVGDVLRASPNLLPIKLAIASSKQRELLKEPTRMAMLIHMTEQLRPPSSRHASNVSESLR